MSPIVAFNLGSFIVQSLLAIGLCISVVSFLLLFADTGLDALLNVAGGTLRLVRWLLSVPARLYDWYLSWPSVQRRRLERRMAFALWKIDWITEEAQADIRTASRLRERYEAAEERPRHAVYGSDAPGDNPPSLDSR